MMYECRMWSLKSGHSAESAAEERLSQTFRTRPRFVSRFPVHCTPQNDDLPAITAPTSTTAATSTGVPKQTMVLSGSRGGGITAERC